MEHTLMDYVVAVLVGIGLGTLIVIIGTWLGKHL